MENFRFIPLVAHTGNKRKVSRKSLSEEIEKQIYFPREGHCGVLLTAKDEFSEENEENFTKITYVVFGGGSKLQPQTWEFASKIYEFSFSVYEDDFDLEGCKELNTTGGILSPLAYASALKLSDEKIIIWGGHNLSQFSTPDELFLLEKKTKNKKTDVEITIYKNHKENAEYKFLQFGDVPSGRCAHTLTYISDNYALLIGGIEMRNRFSAQSLDLFSQFSCDSKFCYLLNTNTFTWKRIDTDGGVPEIAYHSASYFKDTNKLYLFGGIKFTANKPSKHQGPMDTIEIDLSKVLSENKITSNIIELAISTDKPLFFSGQCCSIMGHTVLLFGGHQTNQAEIDKDLIFSAGSTGAAINIINSTCTIIDSSKFNATSGASCFWADKDLFCIVGGEQKQITVYTCKSLGADPCKLGEHCKIKDSPEVHPVRWIFCDQCKLWYHMFCVGLNEATIPKGKYFCPVCLQNSRQNKAKRKRKT